MEIHMLPRWPTRGAQLSFDEHSAPLRSGIGGRIAALVGGTEVMAEVFALGRGPCSKIGMQAWAVNKLRGKLMNTKVWIFIKLDQTSTN